MDSKDICNIREWAPLTVMERIPAKITKGLFPANLNLTCLDAIEEFLALGCDAGIVFWYNRKTGDVQKLRAEIPARITCVKIVDSVEYMIAAGSSIGQVSVFQIQKDVPEDLDLVAPCTKRKPIQRYTIRELHQNWVTCCAWSKNGMKLYSGDRQGIVVLTEFDYQAQLSKSIEVLKESYEIVQLNVYQSYLLVSSLYRNVICQRNAKNGEWIVTQIGKKERKQLIDCGGIFLKTTTSAPTKTTTPISNNKEPLILCGRPGLRFWLANLHGNVEKTLIFRDAVQHSPLWEIPILNPKNFLVQRPKIPSANGYEISDLGNEQNFRNLYLYAGTNTLIVTHDETNLYILNLEKLTLEAVARGFRKILDFCVNGKEIFVLEGERSVLRLAPAPEKPNKTAKVIFNPMMPPPVPLIGFTSNGGFEAPLEYEPDEHLVTHAEECFELPPIEKLNLNIPIELAIESPRAEQNRRLEIFQQIAEQDFDAPIVHHSDSLKPSFKKKRSKSQETRTAEDSVLSKGIVEIAKDVCLTATQSNSNSPINSRCTKSIKSLQFTTKATEMQASFCLSSSSSSTAMDSKKQQIYSEHLPNLLSPTTLQKEIATQAKSLAEELDLPEVSLVPITDEELRQSQALAAPPPPPLPSTNNISSPTSLKTSIPKTPLELSSAYPTNVPLIEDNPQQQAEENSSGKLNTFETLSSKELEEFSSNKKQQQEQQEQSKQQQQQQSEQEIEEDYCGAYSDGQPIDEICSALSLIVKNDDDTISQKSSSSKTFVAIQPQNDDNDYIQEQPEPLDPSQVKSFLLDFNRAQDPLLPKKIKKHSSDSNSSSEWEFLDN